MIATRPMRAVIDGMEAAVSAQEEADFLADERWARARFLARLIPDDVDLSKPCKVALALLEAGYCNRHFADVFDDVMALAFVERMKGEKQ